MKPKKPSSKRAASTARKNVAKGEGASAKRRSTRARAAVNAPPDKYFWVNFGPVLKNLLELRNALADGMNDEQFAHHVNAQRNDFANWVEDVLGNAKCARALRKSGSRSAALRAVQASLGTTR